jgi:hypothetical protein
MNETEIISNQETLQTSENGICLQQWIFERVHSFISGRVLEICDGAGIIAPISVQNGIPAEAKNVDLVDEEFEERYSELIGVYDTLIILNAGVQIKNDQNIVYNSTLLLKQGGHLITRLPAITALYKELTQGFEYWKFHNLEFINKTLRKDFRIMKTRYFIIADGLKTEEWGTKYRERVTPFNTENVTGFTGQGLSMIVVGRKRQ